MKIPVVLGLAPSRARLQSQPAVRTLLAGVAVSLLSLIHSGYGQAWTDPSIREFCGVNQSGTGEALFNSVLSYNRHDISWSSIEPSNGTWDFTSLTNARSEITTLQAKGVRLLPVLNYTAQWAADLSSRQWTLGNDKWTVAPGSGGTMIYNHYNLSTGALISTKTLTDFTKFPPANVANWTGYVQQVMNYLHPAPYNVQYFQIWNEAQETSGFWIGSLDDYIQKIHLPAAQVIHAAGGKVVYGGWPVSGSISEFISVLDRNNAWSSLDVIDTHYFGTSDAFPTLRAAADSRGYTNLAIWQTEVGFTTDFAYIPSSYTHRVYWALSNKWTQDKYKAFYFADWAPNDPKAYGYNCSLNSGSALSGHGQCLQALSGLLGGSAPLNQFPGLTSTPAYPADLSSPTTMECFATGNTIVSAVNLGTSDYNGVASVSFNIPVPRASITKAERVDIIGTRVNLTSSLVANGGSTTLPNVAVKDPAGSSARTWNDATTGQRVFYTVVTLASPVVAKSEAENLSVVAQTAGITARTATDSAFSNGAGAFFDATAAGQFVSYDIPNIAAGTYDVRVGLKSWNNKGTWQLAVSRLDQQGSATNVGSPVDEYSVNPEYVEVDLGLWTPGTTSDKAFKFTVTGKNASSTGYGLSIDYIKLIVQ